MARRNIYIPDELAKRMDRVADSPSWSQVACEAFKLRLGAIAKQREKLAMQDVIDRLRSSKLESGSADRRRGHEHGREWAKRAAEAIELDRLEAGHEVDGSQIVMDDGYTFAERIAFKLSPERHGDRSFARALWKKFVEDAAPSDEMVTGFIGGALAIWNEVKDQI